MYRSSAYSVKLRLEAQIKAQQDIVAACDEAIKRVHPEDKAIKASHDNARAMATVNISRLMTQLDNNRLEIVRGLD